MLTELSLQRFKAHDDTRIPLERLTVLVGPNASGKTSALEAIRLLSRTARSHVSWIALEAEPCLVRQGATEPMTLRCDGLTGGLSWRGRLTVPSNGDLGAAEDEWEPALPHPGQPPFQASFLRLEARRLGEPSYSDQEVPVLAEDGYGLATVLTALKVASTERFNELTNAACRIVPRLRGLGFRRTRLLEQRPRALTVEGQKVIVQDKEVVIADELLLDFEDATGLPAHVASEGTLVVLGILAALYGPGRPSLVLLDDLERALHPKAQRDLVGALRLALDAMPEAQIVATTHSPYLVDALSPEQVVVLGRTAGGAVAAERLGDHPKAGLLDVLTTGEFWAAEGEDWDGSRVSRRFVVVAEDRQLYLLATVLCDRVIAERSGWLRDHWGDEAQRCSFRVWDKLDASSPDAWTTRADVKRLWGEGSAHPLGLKAEGALAYKAAKLALRRTTEAGTKDALFVAHDSDGDEETERRMRAGARAATATSDALVVVIAAPHPEAEAWVAAGIVPETADERAAYEAERRRLGFDPVTKPHRLRSGKAVGKHDAKRTCAAILGDPDESSERWARCWEVTSLPTLESNGEAAGLRAYTMQVADEILPLLGDRSSERR